MRLLPAAIALAIPLLAPAAAAAEPTPFGHACTPQNGVRFCPANELSDRVASWDGTPMDVDVTLPATGDGPFPTIVLEHGFPGSKTTFEATDPQAGENYNNVFYAQQGFAVVNASARGFGRSCGVQESRTPDCAKGYVRIADHRYELRDIQHLLGLLVDQGVTRADQLAFSGVSGGGGRSISAAFLRDRIRMPDGSYAPWTSPNGTPLAYKAVYARWGWADLTSALAPNGRLRDLSVPTETQARTPFGVLKESWINGLLFAAAVVDANIVAPGADAQADLLGWRDLLLRGEPYRADVGRVFDVTHGFIGGAAGISGSSAAPLMLSNGWNDDLFPVDEALRVYERLRTADPNAPVYLVLGDFGHSRAGNPPSTTREANDLASAFINFHTRGGAFGVPAGGVVAYLTACPKGTAGRRLSGATFGALQQGTRVFRSKRPQRIANRAGNQAIADQISNPQVSDPCLSFPAKREPNTADYRFKVKRAFTLLGSPEVRARIRTKGRYGQINARLWEVTGSKQKLLARSVYRLTPDQKGTVRFQLHPQGRELAKGRTLKLQLLGRDAAYARGSNGKFSVRVSNLRLTLPSAEK
jgi:fermentation-respiration switch protein FrsA (DUF1100 family)